VFVVPVLSPVGSSSGVYGFNISSALTGSWTLEK